MILSWPKKILQKSSKYSVIAWQNWEEDSTRSLHNLWKRVFWIVTERQTYMATQWLNWLSGADSVKSQMPFFANVLLCNILSWNSFNKSDSINLRNVIFHVEKTLKAALSNVWRIFQEKLRIAAHLQKKIWYLFEDIQ